MRTLADGYVATGFTFRVRSALVLARINAVVVAASPVVRTILVHLAFALKLEEQLLNIHNGILFKCLEDLSLIC